MASLLCAGAALFVSPSDSRAQQEADAIDPALPVLRSIGEIYAVLAPASNELHPVDLEVHVAYFDPHWDMAYVLSGDAPPQFLSIGKIPLRIQMGDVVRFTGAVRPASKYGFSDFTVSRVVRDRPLKAILAGDNFPALLRLEVAMVEFEAIVDNQFVEDASHLQLHLIVEGQRVLGRLLIDATEPIPDLVGQHLTSAGIMLPARAANSDFVAEILIGSLHAVQVHGLAAESPLFSNLPVIRIADIPAHAISTEVGPSRAVRRVHIEGTVITTSVDRDLSVNDGSGRIRVSTAQTHGVTNGQRIEVCGVPVLTRRGWRLERPFIRASRIAAPASDQPTSPLPAPPAQPKSPDDLPVIRSLQDYWNVPVAEKDWLHHIDIELHVSYCDPGWNIMWAEDRNARSFFSIRRNDIDLTPGQVIRVTGLARPSGALQIDTSLRIDTLEAYRPFEPVPIDGNLTDPSLEGRVVRLTGLVEQQLDLGPYHMGLAMIVDGHPVMARCRSYETERFADYSGQIVTLEGVLVQEWSGGDAFAANVWVGRVSTIQPHAILERDPLFNIPVTAIQQIFDEQPPGMVHLVGRVQSIVPGRSLVIEDHTGQISIRTAQKLQIERGSLVEARGFAQTQDLSTVLARPVIRKALTPGTNFSRAAAGVRKTYRTAESILNLSDKEAAREHDVVLTGVVTWSHKDMPSLFIRDASSGIEVRRPAGTDAPAAAGTVVFVKGTTGQGANASIVRATSIEPRETRLLELPSITTLEQARTGILEAQRIRLLGYVRQVTHAEGWTHLDLLATDGRRFRASMPHHADADTYNGAVIRLSGVCQTQAEPGRGATSVTLLLNSIAEIEEVHMAPDDPFASQPIEAIQALGDASHLRKGMRLAHIRGVVLAALPSGGAVVNDNSGDARGTGGILVYSRDRETPEVGAVVEACGVIGLDDSRVVLREATHRVVAQAREMPVTTLNSVEANSVYDLGLVRISGQLVEISTDEGDIRLWMSRPGTSFQATVPAAAAVSELREKLLPGAVLELTGVYKFEPASEEHAPLFSLLLRSPGDVRVVELPSWFTPERTRMLAGGLAVILALAFGWAYALRRRVQHQTGQIRRQLIKEARLEDRQRNIIEKASDFIFMLDLSGAFTLFNPAGEAMTGYAKDDVPRLTVFDLIDESDRIGLRTMLLKARPGSEIQPFQTQFRRKDGTLIWVEVAIRYLVEEDRVTGALCVARDITERKAVEDELKRARDAAEANTKAKSAFLANMSHEIRTPMNGVIGMSNLLLDTSLNHDQRDFALTIRNSAEALLTVLNDILDFSKIKAGKLQFETLDFDLTETVDDTVDLLAARAASKHLELAALIPTTLPKKLRGDPGRLRQVLLNLIGNAIKFTETGDVSVHVGLERETRDGYLLRFEVRDTGIGIGPAEREQLFMPFSQADASTTRKYGGTGLGLAICRQIIEQMNGQIGVHSEPGKGSTFWFTVELARGSSAPLEPQPEMLRGVRVLGVDDNQINRTVLQHYLEPYGLRLDLASDAQEALGMLRAAATSGDPFRLVLLDYHMPEMDGLALARAIHADARFRALRMALLTSVDRRFTPPELEAIGITASMAKPIRQRELMHTIQRALSAGGAATATAAAQESPAAAILPPMRVLVAEDNLVNQRLTRIQLKKLGYEADLACNGLEVLEAFERVPYDVIFMDCQMPELDGYDTARRLASHPRRGDVRIVAMTANAMQGDRDKCLESGMDDYLSKPTRPDDLTGALRRAAEAIARPAGAQ